MNKIASCVLIEWKKLIKSKLSVITLCSICLVPFIVGLFAVMMKYPENFKNLGLISAKIEMIGITDWLSYFMALSQVISVGGLLIFGFTTSWVFGREYSDKTMVDLLALPIKRDTIVLSKFIVVALWSYIISIFALLLGLLAGKLIGLAGWSSIIFFKGMLTFGYCTTLTVLLSTPVAFFACLGRGYLLPLAFIIFTMLFSQLGSALNLGEYIPWSVPALASGITGKVIFNLGGVISLLGISILGLILTIAWWRYADYN
ncbi:ABC transporter permease [Treponema pedis]|uniref:ABC transporter permease n=1 Tax=Treponema pedis TaxID=409322 RepID=A0A7S6WPP4_9SPIR|nr:ABC transporter permease [Treponema pedis]QOW61030.1 ABC transporter permease [Treponema pedis]